ncbi:MAG: arginyltransferase [Nitrospirae bacterium]|nr:MAG: arginyltransferase [Nitrospirota bacterium]
MEPVRFLLSAKSPCGYLPGRDSAAVVADPEAPLDGAAYATLLAYGFRRSGRLVYRPRCPGCRACVPVRIPVARFRPSRSQRRVWRRNRDLTVAVVPPRFRREHYDLFRRYQRDHHGDTMELARPGEPPEAGYHRFLVASPVATEHHEYRLGGRLVGVGVVDRLPAALSSVYYFYDPEEGRRSLGTYSVLWEVAYARRLGLAHHYLGYWIEACAKMRYKQRFQPLEWFDGAAWRRWPPGESAAAAP